VDVKEPALLGGRYRIDAPIASGGMGVVHRGWDPRLARPVALKVLHPRFAADAEFERRFRAEARHAARVRHPNVVAVLDQDEHDGVPFIVMELITGTTLRNLFRQKQRFTVNDVLHVLEPTCAGLAAIHRTGLVHRDIKPENLLIDEAGELRVADFGISLALDATQQTASGVLLGSVTYMAPEVIMGERPTPASDQYSLGVVLFEALTGRAPFTADDPASLALKHVREVVPPPSSVDSSIGTVLDRVVTTATAREPKDRFASLDALLVAARTAASSGPPALPVVHTSANRTKLRLAPYQPTVRDVPPPPPHPAAPPRPKAPAPRAPRQGAGEHQPPRGPAHQDQRKPAAPVSALAVAAGIFSLFGGISGFFLAPTCAWFALRRIMRRTGRLRGAWIAQVAMGVTALRILDFLATRAP
jgi:eukaryotic-like serine/threonine-protein kinase